MEGVDQSDIKLRFKKPVDEKADIITFTPRSSTRRPKEFIVWVDESQCPWVQEYMDLVGAERIASARVRPDKKFPVIVIRDASDLIMLRMVLS
jgi:hypothetical protein